MTPGVSVFAPLYEKIPRLALSGGGGCFHITLDAADLQLNKRSLFIFLNCKTFSPLIQAVYMYLSDGSYFTKRLSHKVSQIHDANDIFYDKLID